MGPGGGVLFQMSKFIKRLKENGVKQPTERRNTEQVQTGVLDAIGKML